MSEPSMIDQMSEHELRSACKELSIDCERKRKRIIDLKAKLKTSNEIRELNLRDCRKLQDTIERMKPYIRHKLDCNTTELERTYDGLCDCGVVLTIGEQEQGE